MSTDQRPDDILAFDLTDTERSVLAHGLIEWGGPARCTEEMAVAMGFQSRHDLRDQSQRLLAGLVTDAGLSKLDWARVMLATSVVFADDLIGCGLDWSIVTGYSDQETILALRSIQRKVTFDARGLIGTR